MESIRDIFTIGNGPSSSHTMGPAFACEYILKEHKDIESVEVTLYGSLALTGKGHFTDKVILDRFKDIETKIRFDRKTPVAHPNTMDVKVKTKGTCIDYHIVSIGGGSIEINGKRKKNIECYKESTLYDVLRTCYNENINLFDYVMKNEPASTYEYICRVYETMTDAIKRGREDNSIIPGKLKLNSKAKELYDKAKIENSRDLQAKLMVMSAAFAVGEENARGHIVVTAPTCGSCGVIPGVISYLINADYKKDKIIEGLCVAGIIGILVKTNGSISGAVAGCQAEIGTAAAMGAAMVTHVMGGSLKQIAQASEIALEHSLGLTCDPVDGYVQIPCIERNAIFALKSVDSAVLSYSINENESKVKFDEIVKTMLETGKDIKRGYRETSKKGLARLFENKK